ncbi:MAG: ABC transporter ATP-binding protein [Caldisericia bacterium]
MISFEIKNGDFVGLIGANGSGKSTLIKSFFRVADVYAGEIFIDNKNIAKMRYDEIASFVSVQRLVAKTNISLSVKSFIVAGLNKPDEVRLSEILEEFELLDISEKSISDVSDGQLQRVTLAQAVYRNPKVYLLDEPTSHLDLRYKVQLLSGIKKRIKDDSCGLAVIHEIELAKKFCNKVILLHNGRIRAFGGISILDDDSLISEIFDLDII